MEYFFYLIIFLIPYLAVSPWQKVMRIPAGLIYVGLVLVFVLMLLLERPERLRWKNISRVQLVVPLLIFFAVNLFSILRIIISKGMAALNANNLKEMGFLGFAVLFYWAVTVFVDNEERFMKSLKTFVICSSIASIYGITRLILFMVGSDYGLAQGWTVPRLLATAGESQVFGGFVISVLPLMIADVLFKNNIFEGPWNHFHMGILLLALIMTFSAGAWAGLVVAVIFLVLWFRYYSPKSIVSSALVVLVVIMGVFLIDRTIYPNYLEGFNSIVFKITGHAPAPEKFANKNAFEVLKQEMPQSTASRDQQYVESVFSKVERSWFRAALWNMFKSSPILGIGAGNFEALYNKYRPPGVPAPPYVPKPHNQYMEILAETGIIGMLAFIGIILNLFWYIFQCWPRLEPNKRRILVGLVACLLAVGVHGYAFGILVHLQVWLLLALTMSLLKLDPTTRTLSAIRGGLY